MYRRLTFIVVLIVQAGRVPGQVTTGEILGTVLDPNLALSKNVRITIRSLETGAARASVSGDDGRFRVAQLPVGAYELSAEKAGFARYVQGPIVLRLNQIAQIDLQLQLATVTERVNVVADAPLLNASTSELAVNFDRRRISELPLAPNRSLLTLALSAPGVSQLSAGQNPQLSSTLPFSVNGSRTRSNGFLIDGQNSNASVLSGVNQPLNNPDIIAEFRIITNQFAPEYGRSAGSIVNIITKSGANQLHGSGFWFHNSNRLNAPTNLDRSVPFRVENQVGGTLGGPLLKDRAFFFGSLQRWTDRQRTGGPSFTGAPTEEGRAILQSIAGSRPTVKALLDFVPAAQVPVAGVFAPLRVGDQSVNIPLGSLSGTSSVRTDDWQSSSRVDYRLSNKITFGGRYLFGDRIMDGAGQITPPGLGTVQANRYQEATAFLNTTLSGAAFHELRLSYGRVQGGQSPLDPASLLIPSIEVTSLGMTGNAAGPQRTAIGLATDLPRGSSQNRYQLQQTLGLQRGSHFLKVGIDFQRDEVNQLLQATVRGTLVYANLQDLVDDVGASGRINSSLPGGAAKMFTRTYDYGFFLQDEWRVRPSLSLTYGVRYESPGSLIQSLANAAERIVARNGGDPRFALAPVPSRDINNWAPRFGFNYRLPKSVGVLRRLTEDRMLVVRGGYARVYDTTITQIIAQIANSFPFVKSDDLPARSANSLEKIRLLPTQPLGNVNILTRDLVPEDLRSPFAEQFSLQLQRSFRSDWLASLGYVGTKGTALFQQIDLNATVPGSRGALRVDPRLGIRRMRCNCTSSIFHSLQGSVERRMSRDVSVAAHYTWSAFIDGASDFVSPSPNGELAVAQDSYNRRADRGRASFDHPYRFTLNGVFELPFLKSQNGATAKILGGWQASGFLTFQSGTPFTALNGADPGFRLSGLNAMPRASVNTSLDLAGMSVEEIYSAGRENLFAAVTATAPLGNIGRNILRTDGIGALDLGLIKNTRFHETHNLQLRAELYNATNTRNFGIPQGAINSSNFLNQWGTDGGSRRILLALRYSF